MTTKKKKEDKGEINEDNEVNHEDKEEKKVDEKNDFHIIDDSLGGCRGGCPRQHL